MDIFDETVIKFLEALYIHKVNYIMVGGYAANLHGYQRYTGDMDIWIKDSLENRQNIRKAFIYAGMGDFEMIERIQFVPGLTDFMLNNGLKLHLLTGMKGLEGFSFEECLSIAQVGKLNDIEVPFLHINQLIANKKAVNRPKDQIDVIELERIKKLRTEMGFD